MKRREKKRRDPRRIRRRFLKGYPLALSIGKIEDEQQPQQINEDAIQISRNVCAVSDGAGGGGIFADRWSDHLVRSICQEQTPIKSFDALDDFVDRHYDAFYTKYEEKAQQIGGLLLNKFYDEGSLATLSVVWVDPKSATASWIRYGDSTLFHYNCRSGVLESSMPSLTAYNDPPWLINCNDHIEAEGFVSGTFTLTPHCSLLINATDALSHYIWMMYQIYNGKGEEELEKAKQQHSKSVGFLTQGLSYYRYLLSSRRGKRDFYKDVLAPIVLDRRKRKRGCRPQQCFRAHLKGLRDQGLIAYDDYTVGVLCF